MAKRPGSRAGASITIALLGSTMIGCGRPETLPAECAQVAIDVAAGSVGEPTPEAALKQWLATGASPLAPRDGWTMRRENGSLYWANGLHRVEIVDLGTGGGSGWAVTRSNCA